MDFALECRGEVGIRVVRVKGPGGGRVDGKMEVNGAGEGEEEEEAVSVFMGLIESALGRSVSATDDHQVNAQTILILHRSAANALWRLVDPVAATMVGPGAGDRAAGPRAAKGVAARLASRGPWLQQWLGDESSTGVREAFAGVTGVVAGFMDPNKELVPLLRALSLKLKTCTEDRSTLPSNRAVCAAHGATCAIGATLGRLAETHRAGKDAGGAAAAAGGVPVASAGAGGGVAGAWEALAGDAIPAALACVASAVGHPVSLLHTAACTALGRPGMALPLPLPPPQPLAAASSSTTRGSVFTEAEVFRRLWDVCRVGETAESNRRAEASAEALGRLCIGAAMADFDKEGWRKARGTRGSAVRRKTLEVLFSMGKAQKEEELQFAV
ncbi:unnamed protein product, partial [Discosporangium mesarthrocarpum]